MAKLWGGRFSKTTDEMINEFQASIDFDKRMYYEDIKGSIAHATMLKKCNIITEKDHEDIVNGLTAILNDIESGNFCDSRTVFNCSNANTFHRQKINNIREYSLDMTRGHSRELRISVESP